MKYEKSFITCPNCELQEEREVPKEIKKGEAKAFIICGCKVEFEVEAWQFEKLN